MIPYPIWIYTGFTTSITMNAIFGAAIIVNSVIICQIAIYEKHEHRVRGRGKVVYRRRTDGDNWVIVQTGNGHLPLHIRPSH